MRITTFAGVMSAALLAIGVHGIASNALAIEPEAPEALITAETAIGIKVRETLARDPGTDDDSRARSAAIATFYDQRGNQPIWVGLSGFTQRAEAVMAEIRNADAWGLDPDKFDLPHLNRATFAEATPTTPVPAELAQAELAMTREVLRYADHARGGRIDPTKLSGYWDMKGRPTDVAAVLSGLARSDEPRTYLTGLHPKHDQFRKLHKLYLALRGPSAETQEIRLPEGPVLKPGDRHPHVALLRKRLGVEAAPVGPGELGDAVPSATGQQEQGDGDQVASNQAPTGTVSTQPAATDAAAAKPATGAGHETDSSANATADVELYDPQLVSAVEDFQRERGLEVDGVVGSGTRSALNGDRTSTKLQRILVNMERWRYLPDDLAGSSKVYVHANIPEFTIRAFKNGNNVLTERIITGKVTNQTPIFSDEIEWIEFHPVWYVPNSIKTKEILPSLQRSDSILKKHDLRVDCGSRGGAEAVRNGKVDIRSCTVSQGPSGQNVLGYFKFKLPNHHDVYLHDTPQKHLFGQSVRTYSHGCMRLRNPEKMAELILGTDQGMSSGQISAIVNGPRSTQFRHLNQHVPIHITYFTAWVGDDGELRTFGDYYGHDRKLANALTGRGDLLGSAYGVAAAAGENEPRAASNQSQSRSATVWRSDAFSSNR